MKKGFTLIELIFTIVILAITTMAIPRIVAQTAGLNEFAIKQELVMNAKTAMTQIIRAPWDSGYVNAPGACTGIDDLNECARVMPVPIFDLSGVVNSEDLNSLALVNRNGASHENVGNSRKVSTATPTLSRCFGTGANAPDPKCIVSYGWDTTGRGYNDVDDYIVYKPQIDPARIPNRTSGDFLLTTDVSVNVMYVSDALTSTSGGYKNSRAIEANLGIRASSVPTNIKLVEVTAVDRNDRDRNVTLRSYSFNIGSNDI